MTASSYQTFELKRDPRGALHIVLNRPDVRNAFNATMIAELTQVFKKEVMEPEVRVVVLRANGAIFCAGGDLNWMRRSIELSLEDNYKDTTLLTQMFKLMNECPKMVIGAVQGAAIGGGVGLVSVCDWVIASADTQFSLSEVRLGIVPSCIGPFVIAKIGASHARGLFMSAERFQAARAREIGLIHEVVTDAAALDGAVETLLSRVLQCGPKAMGVAKKLVLDLSWPERRAEIGDEMEYVARLLAELRITDEAQEGLRAFLEKRKPQWLSQ
jgi:methylglutaconyl-CoA hydratase